MTKSHVLVTGASGFIGSALLPELVKNGFHVTAVSRMPHVSTIDITWICCDLALSGISETLLKKVDVVINCAARTLNDGEDIISESFFKINRDSALSLFHSALKSDVKAFIQVSSTGVVGPGNYHMDEYVKCNPKNLYEQTKFEAECALLEANRSGRTLLTIVRPSNVFGEGHPRMKLLTWLKMVKRGLVILPTNANKTWVNYIYIGDVSLSITMIALNMLHNSESKIPKIINLNCPATSQDFLEASAYGLGINPRAFHLSPFALLFIGKAFDKVSTIFNRSLPITCEKVKELTNLQVFEADLAKEFLHGFPWIGLREGLRRICNYYYKEGML